MPVQRTVRTSFGATCGCVHVCTTAPSDWRTRFTSTSAGADPSSRYENTTPRCDPRNHFAAEVAVSSAAAPGAGVSSTCASGGGGGRILTGLLGGDWMPPEAMACTGPVWASIGTGTTRAVALRLFTVAAFAAPFAPLPLKTTFVTASRLVPLILAVDPPWIRCLAAQFLTQATLPTVGSGVEATPPPLEGAWAVAGASPAANANHVACVRMPR